MLSALLLQDRVSNENGPDSGYGRLAAGKGCHAYIPIKMASGVQDITCVFVEVAGSYEKKL